MGKILYFRCVIRGGQSSLFVSLWTVSFWQFNNRFGRRIKAEKATVTMLSFPYSWSRTTHAILLGQKQSFNGFALSQIYYRYICFPTTLKPVGIKALEGIPFPYQKYYGSNMFLLCLLSFHRNHIHSHVSNYDGHNWCQKQFRKFWMNSGMGLSSRFMAATVFYIRAIDQSEYFPPA